MPANPDIKVELLLGQNISRKPFSCPQSFFPTTQSALIAVDLSSLSDPTSDSNSASSHGSETERQVTPSVPNGSDKNAFHSAAKGLEQPHLTRVLRAKTVAEPMSQRQTPTKNKLYFRSLFHEMVCTHKSVKEDLSKVISTLRSRSNDTVSQVAAQNLEDIFDVAVKKTARKRIANLSETGSAMSEENSSNHLSIFDNGAHVFISSFAYDKILNFDNKPDGWNHFGVDKNFVGTLESAERLIEQAKLATGDLHGVAYLEDCFGIPKGRWASSEVNSIYRFKIYSPRDLGLSISDGTEHGAFQNEWLCGAFTRGGEAEAVIDAMTREELIERVKRGQIEIEKITFHAGNSIETEKVTFE